jgi:excisionase family DNA binding protein
MEKRQETEKRHFSLRELSERLDVSYRHLHRATKDGRIRVLRLGGAIRVPLKEVERIEEHGF